MDFRQYDNALGRFLNPDRLSELAPSITPYRFAFNNPNYWSDPTGLFESRNAAMAHIETYGLHWATVEYNDGKGVWEITNGSHTFFQRGNDLVLIFEEPGGSGGGVGFVGFDGINAIQTVKITSEVYKGVFETGGANNNWVGGYDVWGSMSLTPIKGALNYAGHLETLTAVIYTGLSRAKDIDPKVIKSFGNTSKYLGKFSPLAASVNTYMDYENPEVSTARFGYRLTGTIVSFATAGRIGGIPGTLAGAGVGLLFGLGEMAYDSAIYGLQQVEHGFNSFYNQVTRGARRF